MDEDELEDIEQELLDQIQRFGIISQKPVDPERVNPDISEEELTEMSREIVEEDNIPEHSDERLSYFISTLKHIFANEGPETTLKMQFLFLTQLAGEIGEQIRVEQDFHRYRSTLEMVDDLDENQTNKAFRYVAEFREEEGLVVAQNTTQLDNLLDSPSEVNVECIESTHAAIETFSKCMDICDTASVQLLAIKRIWEGKDPFDADLRSMGFHARLSELEDSPCNPVVQAINKDLRNAVSHGDLIVNPYDETVKNVDTGREYSFETFAEEVTVAVRVARFLASFALIVMLRWGHIKELTPKDS